MDTIISIYLEIVETKRKDENAYFTVIVPEEKADAARKIMEDHIRELRAHSALQEIGLKTPLVQKLTDAGIACRVLPQRILSNDDKIWTLSLVTKDFYFYIDAENADDSDGFIMFRTQMNEELVSDNYFASVGFYEELIDIAADKAASLYMNSDVSDILENVKEIYRDEIDKVRNSQDSQEGQKEHER